MSPHVICRWPVGVPVALVLLCFSVGCRAEAESDTPKIARGDRPFEVVCTIGQVGDMVRSVGGKHVHVVDLMGAGVDPHLYRATPGDTKRLSQADIVFYNGLHLEGRIAEMLESLARRKPVFAITEQLAAKRSGELRRPAEFEGAYDPHVWFDVSLWASCIDVVVDQLSKLDPEHAAEYRDNAEAYRAKLARLHVWCREEVARIPAAQRVLVTAHDAFGYFGRAYGIEVYAIQGVSTADEADLANINRLVDLLVSRKIKAVFVESSVPPKLVESLIQPAAQRGHKVVTGGELYSDAMGSPGTPEGTYVGMVEHNVNTIVKALK